MTMFTGVVRLKSVSDNGVLCKEQVHDQRERLITSNSRDLNCLLMEELISSSFPDLLSVN